MEKHLAWLCSASSRREDVIEDGDNDEGTSKHRFHETDWWRCSSPPVRNSPPFRFRQLQDGARFLLWIAGTEPEATDTIGTHQSHYAHNTRDGIWLPEAWSMPDKWHALGRNNKRKKRITAQFICVLVDNATMRSCRSFVRLIIMEFTADLFSPSSSSHAVNSCSQRLPVSELRVIRPIKRNS